MVCLEQRSEGMREGAKEILTSQPEWSDEKIEVIESPGECDETAISGIWNKQSFAATTKWLQVIRKLVANTFAEL